MHNKNRRVVITGLGVVAPNGIGKEAFWQALTHGLSGVHSIRRFDTSQLSTKIAGEITDFDPKDYIDPHDIKKMDRSQQFIVAASLLAEIDSGINLSTCNRERIGSSIGNAVCGLESMQNESQLMRDKGPRWGSPYFAIAFFCCGNNGVVSIRLGLKGPILTFSNGNTSATDAIGAGFHTVQSGRADAMFCGGTEGPLIPLMIGSLSRDGWLSTRNDSPSNASRPFDRHCDGIVLGEGAAMLVLEELEHAKARGATIYAEIGAYRSFNSAYHMLYPEPNGLGLVRTMKEALGEAEVSADQVDLINAQGSSLLDYDRMESRCMQEAFADCSVMPRVSAISSMTGNPLGALGGFQAVVSALSLERQTFPPHTNVSEPDSLYPIRLSSAETEAGVLRAAVQNSYCFMGKHSTIVYKKFAGETNG